MAKEFAHLPSGSLVSGRIVAALGAERFLVEAASTTGFMAWRVDDGPILISNAQQVSLGGGHSVMFWSCAGYRDSMPMGVITSLDCHGNGLASLDVAGLTGLESLDCSFNRLGDLRLEGLGELQALNMEGNLLTTLAIGGLRSLRMLNCAGNQLRELDLSGLVALRRVDASNNRLQIIRMPSAGVLTDIRLDGNPDLTDK